MYTLVSTNGRLVEVDPHFPRANDDTRIGTVYIIRLAYPMSGARFYCGWAYHPESRLRVHRSGRGAAILAAASARGIPYEIVAQFPGQTRALERTIKKRGIERWLRSHCPEVLEPRVDD